MKISEKRDYPNYQEGEQIESKAKYSLNNPILVPYGSNRGQTIQEYMYAGCTPAVVTRYQKRISGLLLDRIDIHIEVPSVDYAAGMLREVPHRASSGNYGVVGIAGGQYFSLKIPYPFQGCRFPFCLFWIQSVSR